MDGVIRAPVGVRWVCGGVGVEGRRRRPSGRRRRRRPRRCGCDQL